MMNYIWAGMLVFSFISAAFFGNMQEMSDGIVKAAEDSIEIVLELGGILMLWSGVMAVAKEAGLMDKIARLLSPVIRIVFPKVEPKSETASLISMNITANLLGLGSAATPLGIKAMEKLYEEGGRKRYATDEMIRFVVINTAALKVIPTTIAMFRQEAGAKVPMDILPASLFASGASLLSGLLMAAVLSKIFRPKGE